MIAQNCIGFLLIFLFAGISEGRNSSLDSRWAQYKLKYKKSYGPEESRRRLMWEKCVQYINNHNLDYNSGKHSYRLGENEYSDIDDDEFQQKMTGYNGNSQDSTGNVYESPRGLRMPKTVDWRTQGVVTHVKNQNLCSCCYAFSSTGALEGQVKLRTGRLITLSEQHLIDCSISEGNHGCRGGNMDKAFQYIGKIGGINKETSYPYVAKAGPCRVKRFGAVTGKIRYLKIPQGDEVTLQAAVTTIGPISAAFNAHPRTFHLYSGGIYNDFSCSNNINQLNHAVLVIGYGTENGVDFWLIKNSWGPSWGENGYMRILRKNNLCGIANRALFPVV